MNILQMIVDNKSLYGSKRKKAKDELQEHITLKNKLFLQDRKIKINKIIKRNGQIT